MKAIILAAGRGKRMGSLTDDRPKCFAEVNGRRLLDWQLAALRGAGIQEIGIVRGYLGECFKEPLKYFENSRWQETNMVHSLMQAREWLISDVCIVSYSDIFYGTDSVNRLIQSRLPCNVALTYDPNWLEVWSKRFTNPLDDAETFRVNHSGILLEIGRRPNTLAEVEGQYMGLLKFTPAGWTSIERYLELIGSAVSNRLDMTGLLGRLIDEGMEICAVPIAERWGEVDSLEDLKSYE